MKILVTTPTGNIGGVVVKRLLEAGADVSVIARNPDRLAADVRNRVTVHTGDLQDADAVIRASKDAGALFWLTPPNYAAPDWNVYYGEMAEVAAQAVKENGIPHVVNLSSAGAHRAEGLGPISLLQRVENALAATGANVLHLRPGYFYENFLQQVEPIRGMGSLFLPFAPEVTFPMIATRDIGDVAARRLLARDFSGVSTLGLHGPLPQLTIGETAEAIGEGIGRPVRLVTITLDELRQQFVGAGLSPVAIESYAEMTGALAEGFETAEPRATETTTPTTMREWAAEVMRPMVEAS